jgi:hypothetical protein
MIVFRLASAGVFNRFDIAQDLGRRLVAAEQAVEHVDADLLLSTPTRDLVAKIVGDCDIEPPEVLWDEAEQLPTEESQMDVSGDFRYSDPDRPGPIMVAAARVTIAVPVTGEAKMLGEIELAVLAEQCLDRRLADRATLEHLYPTIQS